MARMVPWEAVVETVVMVAMAEPEVTVDPEHLEETADWAAQVPWVNKVVRAVLAVLAAWVVLAV